ncbi:MULTISPECIES: MurR/RpiR family transcriptional regulator [Mesorhizobium]|uniref:MurR/RpiR family transcriptional regulator n=1 Tax=Mesorhizobium neociceri TaxID=1307853 RepID=A0A838B861_9HYPH|nr:MULTISPECIES: MurR/RpiR family transcriptional regulator [Mesorhizobium]MBA1142322.1 MurR/RpiR family transcriptional regulator [Mesorhizobium neociceri]
MQENVIARLRSSQPSLSPALLRIGEYVLKDPSVVVNQTITEVADGAGASEASVLRFCRDIGFTSFQRFKLALGIELSSGRAKEVRTPSGDIVEDALSEVITALTRTGDLLDRSQLSSAAKHIVKATSIDLYGVAGSASVARYAHYSFTRLGLISRVLDDPHLAIMSAVGLGPKQVAIAISESGSTKETINAIVAAKATGAFTIAITSHIRSPIVAHANAVLASASSDTPIMRGFFLRTAGQYLILDLLTSMIAKTSKQAGISMQATAEATIDKSY